MGHVGVSLAQLISTAVPRPWLLSIALTGCVLATASCTVRKIDPANPARGVTLGSVHSPSSGLWPRRLRPTKPSFVVKQGKPPVDEGNFMNCRVLKAGDVKDGVALIVASRRRIPIQERDEPFTLTVIGRGEDQEIELKTKDHRITLAVVRAAKTKKPRGLVLYLASIMLISNEEKAFIRKLQQRGWNVAAITPPIDLFAKDRWDQEWNADQVNQHANLVAHEIDNCLAESAYAAESVLAYLAQKNPKWVRGARVVIGASVGALATPAVLKRIGGADAVVYIGGGANVPEVALESSIDIYQPKIRVSDGLSASLRREKVAETRRRLKELALQRSRVDPLKVAPTLPQIPTLMLSGEMDHIVPAHTGDLLYHALGRPERWRYPVGHILLFLGLPLQAERVANWMEEKIGAGSE
jgi:dienelactone hydrolase